VKRVNFFTAQYVIYNCTYNFRTSHFVQNCTLKKTLFVASGTVLHIVRCLSTDISALDLRIRFPEIKYKYIINIFDTKLNRKTVKRHT
jgi:hypothetical protein